MFRWFFNLLYGSTPFELESAYSLDQSVDRLRAHTKRSILSALAQQAAVGTVTATRVKLQRVIPMVGNSFKPLFIGQFVTRGDRIFLTGRFTMPIFAKVFLSFWFGVLALMAVMANAAFVFSHDKSAGKSALLFAPAAMFAAGVAFVSLGKWFGRNDAAWLADTIRRSIGGMSPDPAPPVAGRPTIVTVTAGVLALMGGMNLIAALFALPPGSRGPSAPMMIRYFLGVQGISLLALAGGVYLRSLIAWRAGFLLLGSAWLCSVANLLILSDATEPPRIIRFALVPLSLVVMLFWGRWWYAMRVHFTASEAR